MSEFTDKMKVLREPIPGATSQGNPKYQDCLNRLDKVFGSRWKMSVSVEGSAVSVKIGIPRGAGAYVDRTALAMNFKDAFVLCCVLLGVGRPIEATEE